jgi:hypothetical protein
VVGAIASCWAAAWSAFVIASAMGDDWRGHLIAAGFLAAVWAPVIAAWRLPCVGGLALASLGLWGWGFFHSRAALVGLSIPAILHGLAFVTLGVAAAWQRSRSRRRAARA